MILLDNETFFLENKFYFDQYCNLAASVSMNLQCESKYIKNEGTFKGYQPMFSPNIYVYIHIYSHRNFKTSSTIIEKISNRFSFNKKIHVFSIFS